MTDSPMTNGMTYQPFMSAGQQYVRLEGDACIGPVLLRRLAFFRKCDGGRWSGGSFEKQRDTLARMRMLEQRGDRLYITQRGFDVLKAAGMEP